MTPPEPSRAHPDNRPTPPADPVTAHPDGADPDALLVAAGRGDLDAFGAFYDRTAPVVFGMLRAVLGHTARVARLTADVYLQLWRTAPGFDPTVRSARATLLVTAHRALIGAVHTGLTDTEATTSTRGIRR